MEFLYILLAIIAGALAIYYYVFRDLNYFKGTGVPYIQPLPLCGNLTGVIFRLRSAVDTMEEIYWQSPEAKYVGMFDFMSPAILLRDVDLIKSVGLKNFENFRNHRRFIDEVHDPLFGKNLLSLRDEKWRETRNMLSPAFTSSKMKSMFVLILDYAKEFADMLAEMPEDKRAEVEIKDAFTRYTSDVIGTCVFGVSVNSMKNPKNEFYIMGREAINFNGIRALKFLIFRALPKLAVILRLRVVSDRVCKFFTDMVNTTIRTRDEKGITRPDMIQLMMETRGKRGENKELTIVDMTAQAMIFFFGGFDTTSTVMCFTAHEIAVNSSIQTKLQEEIDSVLEENNGVVNYEIINNMEYLDAVINEALRMYPALIWVDRQCSNDFELPPTLPGAKPFVVKKGMCVLFPLYGLHHDPQYFENPHKFDPDRFFGKNKKNLNPAAFMPFGVGPRMCIGNRFALLEIKALFFHLLARCTLKPCAKTVIPMKFVKTTIIMLPEGGFWLSLEPRHKSPNAQTVMEKKRN